MTLGILDLEQAARLKPSGLDYYIDTSERYYSETISTLSFAAGLDTLELVRQSQH